MKKIITIEEAVTISGSLKEQGYRIVLVGGCFDILHIGHIIFLQKAKKQADILFVLLENDKRVHELKGEGRPVNLFSARAAALARLSSVDYIISLPAIMTNVDYDDLVKKIKPDIIAVTKNDLLLKHKKRSASMIQAKIICVTDRIGNHSTSNIITARANQK